MLQGGQLVAMVLNAATNYCYTHSKTCVLIISSTILRCVLFTCLVALKIVGESNGRGR
jgi:hypothetical protein